MFWIDSDILLLENPKNIADFILEAEKKSLSFTTNYRAIDNNKGLILNTAASRDKRYTDSDLKNAKPFELKCVDSGLGIGYIKTPLEYKFNTSAHYLDDYMFFKDNPAIDVRYVPISNIHIKTINLLFDHTKLSDSGSNV